MPGHRTSSSGSVCNRVDWKRSKLSIIDFEITSYHGKNQKNLFWQFCNIAELCKHEGFPLSFDCEDFSCGNDCAHHCSCSVPSRQEVGCIFCYDIAMIEQIHMDNAAICSEAGDISFSQDSRKLHKLFWYCKWMCQFFGMTGLQNICPDTNKAQNCHIRKHQIPDPP